MVSSDDTSLQRRSFLAVAGGTSAAALAGCTDLFDEDEDNGDEQAFENNVEKAQAAWERVIDNPGPEDEDIRNEAYVDMEEARRDDMILLPLFHNLEERFWRDAIDIEPSGALGGHRQQYDDVTKEDGDTLELIQSSVSSLDPIQSTDTASASVIRQVYEGLTHYPNGVSELENLLAEEVEVSDDATEYTITLEEGVEFHNGDELTANDVVYSWRRLAESPNSERADFLLGPGFLGVDYDPAEEGEGVGPLNIEPGSVAVEAEDDHTLTFELTDPEPAALDIIAYDSFAVVPEGYVDDLEDIDGEISQQEFSDSDMVGTGPFEFVEWDSGTEVRVEAYEDYHDGSAEVDEVRWSIIENDDAIWTRITERNADVFGIPTQFYDPDLVDAETDDLEREVGEYGPVDDLDGDMLNYLGVAELSTFYVGFNADSVPLPVREAIAYVTDHEEVIDEVFQGRGQPAYSFLPPGTWPSDVVEYDEFAEDYPYGKDTTELIDAEETLQEAGYSSEDPFELDFTTYQDQAFQEFVELTRDKLAGTGIDVNIDETEFDILQTRGEDGDLEAYTLGWIWSWVDPAYGLFGLEPENTETDVMPEETNGYYLNWEATVDEDNGSDDGNNEE